MKIKGTTIKKIYSGYATPMGSTRQYKRRKK